MKFVQFGNRKIHFEIKKGNRIKTVAIHINPTGYITVLSPQSLDEESNPKILYKRGKWIIEKQEQIKKNRDANLVKAICERRILSIPGQILPFEGNESDYWR